MRVRACGSGVVFHVFTRVWDTCEVFVSAVARVCVRYSDVLHVCTYTMLDSTTGVSPYMIVCLYGVLRRRLQSRTGAGEDGASSFTL